MNLYLLNLVLNLFKNSFQNIKMSKKKSLPGPITILMFVIILAAIGTWLLPSGQYDRLGVDTAKKNFVLTTSTKEIKLPLTQKTLDSLKILIPIQKFTTGEIRKPVSVPNTYHQLNKNPQGFLSVLQAPIKGIIESIDIALFVLIIGGFMYVFNETGAMVRGISSLSHSMRGKESKLIVILTLIFSFLSASYGMAEETFVFYPLIVPIFLAAGYDLLVPLAIIYGGISIGGMSNFSNPFSVIIASNAAGINWMDGLYERLIMYVVSNGIFLWYLLRYAAKIKKDPKKSLVYQIDGSIHPVFDLNLEQKNKTEKLDFKTKLLLAVYVASFVTLIFGVVFLDWWTTEMSTLFLGASILVAIIVKMKEQKFIVEFIKGCESLLSVAFIIGVARGVTIILTEGNISDSILYYGSNMMQGVSPIIFIILLLCFYIVFSIFIQSSSGMAVLTMPIIGALAIIMNIPGREIVNSYIYGMAIMGFVAPTGLILPSLALLNISYKTWLKFINPVLIALTVLCVVFLIIGIYL